MGYTHALFGAGLASWLDPAHPLAASFWGYLGSTVPDLDLKFKHRKLLHNLFSLALFSTLVYLVVGKGWAALDFSVGYFSHLILDSITVKGVWLFWPLYNKSFGLRLTRSDNLAANALFSFLGILLLISSWLQLGP